MCHSCAMLKNVPVVALKLLVVHVYMQGMNPTVPFNDVYT